ncbi:MAG: cytochrome D1 domain-containing protein [Halobacteriales archaeon]|nr:cytochrome D1 domain-containing protein [Halobacteriales archaeon]
MSQQQASDAESDPDQRRIKRYLSGSRDVAKQLDFEDELAFNEFVRDEVTVDDPVRRRLLKASGAATIGTALAGCEAPSGAQETATPEPAQTDTPAGDQTTATQTEAQKQAARTKEFEIVAFQWGFKPQQIKVQKNTEVVLKFTKSTFEENSDFNVHSFYLEEPYDVGPIELHKDTDPDVDKKVSFVADQTGEFQYECTIYCGTKHADMKGTLVVTEEGGGQQAKTTDFTNMKDIKGTQEVLTQPGDLPQSPQHDVDLKDLMVVTERENASVTMVDTINNEMLSRVNDVGKAIHVHDFASGPLTGKREDAYVYTLARSGWLYKVDLFGFNRVARVRGGTDARKPATSRDDNYVIAGFYNPNHLLIADAEDLTPLKRIPTWGVNPDGESVKSRVCAVHDVSREGVWVVALKEAGQVWMIDYTKDGFPVTDTFRVGGVLHDGFFTGEGRYFHIASQEDNLMGVIDTKKRELVAKVPTAKVPHPGTPFCQDAKRNLAFVPCAGANKVTVYDTETFERVKNIDVPGKGLFSFKMPDDECKYVWTDNVLTADHTAAATVNQIDPETLELRKTVDTSKLVDFSGTETHPKSRALHPEFSRDGSKVFVSLWDAGKIVVLDSETGEHLDTIEGLETPTGEFTGYRAAEYGKAEEL